MIIFDTETTGLIDNTALPLSKQPQIIELFASKYDNETLEHVGDWHSLFFAPNVPDEVVKITSITTEMLVDQPKFVQKIDSLIEFFLGETHAFGHNLSFDMTMLWLDLKRIDFDKRFPFPQHQICTVEATEGDKGFRQSLADLHQELFGESFDGAHRAKSDVQATSRCVIELIKNGSIKL